MQIVRLHRSSPEQVFATVRNVDTSVMSVGHAAMWDFPVVASGTGTGDGYSVRFNITTAAEQINPALFAGIVARNDIQVGDYGLVQVYGYHTGVYVTGASANPFNGATVFQATNRTSVSLTNVILKPVCFASNTTGAATNAGYLGAMALQTALGATTGAEAAALEHCWPGGYCIPLGNLNGNATATYTSSASIKAFIKCL